MVYTACCITPYIQHYRTTSTETQQLYLSIAPVGICPNLVWVSPLEKWEVSGGNQYLGAIPFLPGTPKILCFLFI